MNTNRENVLNDILNKNQIKDEKAKEKIVSFFKKFNEIVDELIKYDFNSNYIPQTKISDLILIFEEILNSSFKEKKNVLIALYEINIYFRMLIIAHMSKIKNIVDSAIMQSEIGIKEDI
jgi:hypothetical protein